MFFLVVGFVEGIGILMLNVVSLLPHCKKDSKVESKESKEATLNELVELENCSYCLLFEVKASPFLSFPMRNEDIWLLEHLKFVCIF